MSETQLRQQVIQKLDGMGQETLALLDRFIDSLNIYRQSQQSMTSEAVTDDEQHDVVRSLRGMAAQSTLSSDDFASRKQAEIDWEERNV